MVEVAGGGMWYGQIGDEMVMTVNRGGTLIEVILVLGERPQN